MINVRNDGEIADMFHGLARKIHEWVGLSVAVPRAAAKYIRSAGIMSQVVALQLCSDPTAMRLICLFRQVIQNFPDCVAFKRVLADKFARIFEHWNSRSVFAA